MEADKDKEKQTYSNMFSRSFPETAAWILLAADFDGGCKKRYYLNESTGLFKAPDGRFYFATMRKYEYYERSYNSNDDYEEKNMYPVDEERAKSMFESMKLKFIDL